MEIIVGRKSMATKRKRSVCVSRTFLKEESLTKTGPLDDCKTLLEQIVESSSYQKANTTHGLALKPEDEYLIRTGRNSAPKQGLSLQHLLKKGEKETTASTRHWVRNRSYISAVIMASTVWWTWCTTVDNCVKVEAVDPFRCPADCRCVTSSKEVHCDDRSLRTVPPEIPRTAKILTLANNNLADLSRNAFQHLTGLKTLQLSHNRIRNIPGNVFYGIRDLEKLDVSENKLTKIPRHALGYLKNLRELNLRNNPITQILSYHFIPPGKTLLKLDLGELRHLTYVSKQAFDGLDNLKTLQMDNCNLQELPRLQPLSGVKKVDFSFNKLTVIRSSDFAILYQLEDLSLASCDIAIIEKEAFDDLRSLQNLDLTNNNISTLKGALFDNKILQSLRLQMNPWTCNCDLLSLAEYIQLNLPCNGDTCAQCQYPPAYKSITIQSLVNMNDTPCVPAIDDPSGEQQINVLKGRQLSVNVSAGEGTRLPCPTYSPNDQPQIQSVKWIMPNGRFLQHGRYTVRIKKLDNGELNFTKVTLQDKGTYTCSVTKADNGVTNSTVYLNVTPSTISVVSRFTTVTTTTPTKVPMAATTTKKIRTMTPRRSFSGTRTKSNIGKQVFDANMGRTGAPTTLKQIPTIQPMDQVSTTSAILIGCFASLILLVAICLIGLYKVRKRHSPSPPSNSVHNKAGKEKHYNLDHCLSEGSENSHSYDSSAVLTHNTTHRDNGGINDKTAHLATNRWLATLQWSDHQLPSARYHLSLPTDKALAKVAEENENSEICLPPPMRTVKQNPREAIPTAALKMKHPQNESVVRNVDEIVRLRNADPGQFTQQKLLSHLAASCQNVALKRRSEGSYNVTHMDGQKIKLTKHAANNNHFNSCGNICQQQEFKAHHSVPNETSILFDTELQKLNPSIGSCGNNDTTQKSLDKVNNKPKRKIQIKVKNLEELLSHKETEI